MEYTFERSGEERRPLLLEDFNSEEQSEYFNMVEDDEEESVFESSEDNLFTKVQRAYIDILDAELTMGTNFLFLVRKQDMIDFLSS